jgi:serine/threonine-protein kinase
VKDWDRYEFLGFLGQGGMGMVFLARDRKLGREVAIKFVRIEDERHLQRFMVEARAQARVDHEHVCKVFEVGEVECLGGDGVRVCWDFPRRS